tara:strand:- start:149 stop:808 length:660 start_codon:yes stop_codon:yes gene_type:complete
MKKRFLIALILLLSLSTYKMQENFQLNTKLKIDEIIIENNSILQNTMIEKKLSQLYETNLFILNKKKISDGLKELNFVDSFEVKKIYPNRLKIRIFEKEPIAIIYYKDEKKYLTNKNELIDFIELEKFKQLPMVFGDREKFKILYMNLKKNKFPLDDIKKFHLFETNRWDLVTKKNQTIKLPSKDYIKSLENFIFLKDQANFEKYKIFDYRINQQLILK